MSHSLCKTSVLRIYQDVMEDVISGVRDYFLEEGVDENLLQELKQLWETKLMASKAVQSEEEKKKPEPPPPASNGFPRPQPQAQQQAPQPPPPQQQPTQGLVAATQPVAPQQVVIETKMVPIQITLPPQPGSDGGQRVLTIQVPHTALQGNQLQKVLTGPIITATMGLPANIASSVLQQHVNAAFSSQQTVQVIQKPVLQTDGAGDEEDDEEIEIEFIWSSKNKQKKTKATNKKGKKPRTLLQTDGPMDTSDEDDDASDGDDDDDDLDDDNDEQDQEMEDEGGEEEPLNSEDDVTDEDPNDLFDTDNIVVCQYDKIIRNRNKWKFYLKDGIMNLHGQDYVFQKANGDAEW